MRAPAHTRTRVSNKSLIIEIIATTAYINNGRNDYNEQWFTFTRARVRACAITSQYTNTRGVMSDECGAVRDTRLSSTHTDCYSRCGHPGRTRCTARMAQYEVCCGVPGRTGIPCPRSRSTWEIGPVSRWDSFTVPCGRSASVRGGHIVTPEIPRNATRRVAFGTLRTSRLTDVPSLLPRGLCRNDASDVPPRIGPDSCVRVAPDSGIQSVIGYGPLSPSSRTKRPTSCQLDRS
jgi:hypothetical protein